MAKNSPATIHDTPQMTLAQLCAEHMPHINDKKKPIGCIDNLSILLDYLKIEVRYNVISKEVEIIIPRKEFSIDNGYNASLGHIASKIKEIGMGTEFFKDFLLVIADRHQYNPVEEWILSRKLVKKSLLQEFYDTLTTTPDKKELKESLMYRWMVGAVASACSPGGIDSAGILVLQGAQNLGKTWWFRKLVPQDQLPNVTRADASIDPHDKDSVEQAVCHWLVELGELDGVFKKSEIAALKSFITRDSDTFRKSFAPRASKYPRRTVFAASVNPWNFLTDETGNRRFWTIECTKVDSYHTIDMQQVWREVYDNWKRGDTWRLSDNERILLDDLNEDHLVNDPVMENIQQKLKWDSKKDWRWLTATEILEELRVSRITRAELRICADVMRKMNGNDSSRYARVAGKKTHLTPPLKSTYNQTIESENENV